MKKLVEINQDSGKRLKEMLTELNMSQKDAADIFNYTEQHISAVINGKRRLSSEFADIIISKCPYIRREWILGIDEVKTIYEAEYRKVVYFSDELNEIIKMDAISETHLIWSASKFGYEIKNIDGILSFEQLAKKRAQRLLTELKRRASNNESLDDLTKIFNLLWVPEKYEITRNAEVVANCDSNDIVKMNKNLNDYLSFLVYQFVMNQQQYRTLSNDTNI